MLSVLSQTKIPYAYFGVFDGHAGSGASLWSCNLLHLHINEKLNWAKELLGFEADEKLQKASCLSEASSVATITRDNLVIGAMEEAFFEMVSVLGNHTRILQMMKIGSVEC